MGFFAGGKLKRISQRGGTAFTLCDAPEARGACWGDDNHIFFAPLQAGGLWRVTAAGGAPCLVTTPNVQVGEVTHRWPEVLPGGKAVLFTIGTAGSASYDQARIATLRLESSEQRALIEGGTHARYLPTGHLAFVRGGVLFAAPFDPSRLELTGPAAPLVEHILTEATGAAQWAVSGGALVYVSGAARESKSTLLWVNRKGVERALPAPTRSFEEPRISPDGQRVAVAIREATNDVWVLEAKRGTLTRLTFEGNNYSPIWTPDGKRITFSSNRDGPSSVFWGPADGSAPAEKLLESEFDLIASSWSPNCRALAFTEYHPETGADLWVLNLRGERKSGPFLRTPFHEWGGVFSPDGRYLAYASEESGTPEVYVQAFPGLGGKWQISTEGGSEPLWARDGKELFFRKGDQLMAVRVHTKSGFSPGKARVLFAGPYRTGGLPYLPNYDVAPDGRTFLLLRESETQFNVTQLRIVLDWFEELTQR